MSALFSPRQRRARCLPFLLVATLHLLPQVAANLWAADRIPPTTAKPAPLLDVRTEEMRKIVADAEAALTTIHKLLDPLEPKRLANNLAPGDAKAVSPAGALLTELQWHALRLTRRQEAAGHDLELRRARLEGQLGEAVNQFRALPKFSSATMEAQTSAAIAAAVKQVPKLTQMVESGRLAEAEAAYYKLLSEINRSGVWLRNTDHGREMAPLFEVHGKFQGALVEKDSAALQAELQAEIAKLRPAYPTFVSEAEAAATALAAGPQAPWRGGSLSSPELVRALLANWSRMQLAVHRCRAAAWSAAAWNLQATGEATAANVLQSLEAEQQAAAQRLPELLAAVVRSEAQRASATEAQAAYPRLLEELAPAAALGPREPWRKALDPALNELAAKAGLATEVEHYRRATAPVLHWRRRIARVEAARRSAELTELRALCDPAIRQNPSDGFLPQRENGLDNMSLYSPVDAVLVRAAPELVNKPVLAHDLVAGQTAVYARLAQRVYASLAKPAAPTLAEQVASLERSLYASNTASLTLDASAALWGARHGVYSAAGGVVQGAAVESLLARYSALDDGDLPLLPQRELVTTDLLTMPVPLGVMLHVRLKPQWLQHECFVADTP